MSSSVSKRPRKLIKCMYFYKKSDSSPNIYFAILTEDGNYSEFYFKNMCEGFGPSLIKKLRRFFGGFSLDKNTDVAFSEEFASNDSVHFYFALIRDHVKFRLSHIALKKIIRGIAHKHPRSVMQQIEIARHKRGTVNPKKIGVERFNKVWQYLVEKEKGIQCPWISKEADTWLSNKSKTIARKHKQMRLAIYYLVAKNDMYGSDEIREKMYQQNKARRERMFPKVDLQAL